MLTLAAKRKDIQKLFCSRIETAAKDAQIWIPASEVTYLGDLCTERALHPIPHDLTLSLRHRRNNLPNNLTQLYDRYMSLGDDILYYGLALRIPSILGTVSEAQTFYGNAARIGERIHDPRAGILDGLSENLPKYEEPLIYVFQRVA